MWYGSYMCWLFQALPAHTNSVYLQLIYFARYFLSGNITMTLETRVNLPCLGNTKAMNIIEERLSLIINTSFLMLQTFNMNLRPLLLPFSLTKFYSA